MSRRCQPGCVCRRHVKTAQHRARISAAKMGHPGAPGSGRKRGERPPSYTAVHKRLRQDRGTPSLCEHCGTTTARKYEWAFAGDGHDRSSAAYSADLTEYVRLCTPCHYAFDHPKGGDVACQSPA